MSNIRIEDFILQNKDAFDIIEPAPLAATGLVAASTITSSSIKSITMKILAVISITSATVVGVLTFSNRNESNIAQPAKQSGTVATISEQAANKEDIKLSQSSEVPTSLENPMAQREKNIIGNIMDEEPEPNPEIYSSNNYTTIKWDSIQMRQPETYTWTQKGKNIALNIDTVFSGITHVEINTNSYDVVVVGKSGTNNVTLTAKAEGKAKGIVVNEPKLEVVCTVEGSVLKVKAKMGGTAGVGTFEFDGSMQLQIPENATCKFDQSFGNMEVSNLQTQKFDLDVTSSNLKLFNITAPINANMEYSNVQMDNTSGGLNLLFNSSNITLGNQTGNVQIKSDYSNLSMGGINGNITGSAESGKIEMMDIMGNIQYKSDYSNIKLQNVKGDLHINANSGNIVGENIELVNAATINNVYGSVDLDLANEISKMSFDLSVKYGNISVHDGTNTRNSQGDLLIDRGGIIFKSAIDSGNIKIK